MREDTSSRNCDIERNSDGRDRLRKVLSLGRLVRVTAWVLRMKKNLLAKIKPTNEFAVGEESLTPEELEKSRIFWIKEVQKGLEVRVKANELKTLSPFEDKEGIIRVGGRIDNAR